MSAAPSALGLPSGWFVAGMSEDERLGQALFHLAAGGMPPCGSAGGLAVAPRKKRGRRVDPRKPPSSW
jgi:hypothetical protein